MICLILIFNRKLSFIKIEVFYRKIIMSRKEYENEKMRSSLYRKPPSQKVVTNRFFV